MEKDILESHLAESKQLIIDRVNQALKPMDETNKSRLRLLTQRLSNIGNTDLILLANERLNDFEEKITNLGFASNVIETMTETYKQKLVDFINAGLRGYLFTPRSSNNE